MTSAHADPEDKIGPSVGPAAPSKELTDSLSYVREAVAPDSAKHSSALTYPAGGPQACLASPVPPPQAIQCAQSSGSQFQQAQLDEIAKRVWVIQESIKALVGPALARVAAIIAPYEDCIARVQQLSVNIQRLLASPEVREFIEHWQRNVRVKQALDRAGWLPHPTIPDEIVLEALDGEGAGGVEENVERYLRDNWESVAAEFSDRFRRSGADEETLASMDEALQCRAHGLHRATCRAIFPEVERAVRLRLSPPDPTKMASLVEFRRLIAELPVGAFGLTGMLWMSVFEHVQEACYAKVGGHVSEDEFFLPNRHAVAHGRLPYSTPRDSMNSLVIADFLLTCVDPVVAYLSAVDHPSLE